MKNQNYINEYLTEVEVSIIKFPLVLMKAELKRVTHWKFMAWLEDNEIYGEARKAKQKLFDDWDLYIASRYTY